MKKTPSKQQVRLLRSLPLQVGHVKTMDGNRARTVKSLIDHGWAAWSGLGGWSVLSVTEQGRNALELYKARRQ